MTLQEALRQAGVENALRPIHQSPFAPGLPCGVVEDCYDCGVWWYTRPDRRGGFVVRWACALATSAGSNVFNVGSALSEFSSRADAICAGTDAACAAAARRS